MKKIIIADDHSFIRLGLIQILKDEYPSIEIKEVSNGKDLINAVIKEDFDLVISDLDMPEKNGLEAIEQIKLFKPKLPILILSIFTEDLYAVRVLKAGAWGYMNKNTAPYELINAIQKIKLGKKYITSEIAEKLLEDQLETKFLHNTLSNREFEILKLLATGKTIAQIATSINIAPTTVSTYRARIIEKLQLTNNADIVRYALTHHIIPDIDH